MHRGGKVVSIKLFSYRQHIWPQKWAQVFHPSLAFLSLPHPPPPRPREIPTVYKSSGSQARLSHALGIRCKRLLSNKQPIERAARSLLGLFKVRLKPPFKRWSNYNGQRLAMVKVLLLIRTVKSL